MAVPSGEALAQAKVPPHLRSGRFPLPAEPVVEPAGNAWRDAALVFVAYLAGTKAGLLLTFGPNPVSALWPPNAILLAALLLVPQQRWLVVLAAALPAHLLAELQGGIPLPMVLCWYLSNVAEALIGAVAVGWLAERPLQFDSVAVVVRFTVSVIAGAVLSSYLDCAFVALNGWGHSSYWDNWQMRTWSNITAAITITPAIVAGAAAIAAWQRPNAGRIVEAVLLAAGLLFVTVAVFDTEAAKSGLRGQMYLPLPFLFWAALRFGAAGASLSMAAVATLAVWGAGHGVGALGTSSSLENARSVQVFLVTIGPVMLCLAALMRERSQVEDSLRESDRRFEQVLEATRDSVYDLDLATGELWWSPSGLTQFGYAGEASRPAHDEWADLLHDADAGQVAAERRLALQQDTPFWESEFRLRRSDGSYAHVHEQGFILRDAHRRPLRMIGALTDVTERRDTDELGHRLAHASRLASMGELAASIAHEIHQPMGAILHNVESARMLLDSGQADPQELRAILEDIRSDDLRAAETIRHIRDLANKHQVDFQPFDLNELVGAAIRLVDPVARVRGVSIRVEFGDLPPVRGDRIYLQQLLLNLLFNAMDAMSGTAPDARRVKVRTAFASDHVRVTVADRGHGIPPEKLETIFESFYTTKPDGMGLGLSIARSLVRLHGGSIWAEGNPHGGATFHFTLPVGAKSVAPA